MSFSFEFLVTVLISLTVIIAYLSNSIIEHAAIGQPMFTTFNESEKTMWDSIRAEYKAELLSKNVQVNRQSALDRLRNSKIQRDHDLFEYDFLLNESTTWENDDSKRWKQELETLRQMKSEILANQRELNNLRKAERDRQLNEKELLFLRDKNITSIESDKRVKAELEILRSEDKQRNETLKEVKKLKQIDSQLSSDLTILTRSIRNTKNEIEKAEKTLRKLSDDLIFLNKRENILIRELKQSKDFIGSLELLELDYKTQVLNNVTYEFYNMTADLIENNSTFQHCLIDLYDSARMLNFYNITTKSPTNGSFKFNCIDHSYLNTFKLNEIVNNLSNFTKSFLSANHNFRRINRGLFDGYKLKIGNHTNPNIILYLTNI